MSVPAMTMSSKITLGDNSNNNSRSHTLFIRNSSGHHFPNSVLSPLPQQPYHQQKGKEPRALVIAFALTYQDTLAFDHVSKGNVLVSDFFAKWLFDSGSSHSFISFAFASQLGVSHVGMDAFLLVEKPLEGSQEAEWLYKDCIIQMDDRTLFRNLILLDMSDFDVILGMHWLSSNHASID